MVLTNLIISELLISGIGVPLDVVGNIIYGEPPGQLYCSTVAFIHTLLGKYKLGSYI